jgi:hypothetical protein
MFRSLIRSAAIAFARMSFPPKDGKKKSILSFGGIMNSPAFISVDD